MTSVSFSYNDATSVILLTSCDLDLTCPPPRRDATVRIMDNEGGANGKLLVFGGMGCQNQECGQSGFQDFLAGRSSSSSVLYDDLWCCCCLSHELYLTSPKVPRPPRPHHAVCRHRRLPGILAMDEGEERTERMQRAMLL